MRNFNGIYLKPKDLQVLERITYIGAFKKIQKIKENIDRFGLNGEGFNPFESKTHISLTLYADYYGIDINHLHSALSENRLLLIKPSDLILLEAANNIKTASYRYKNYLYQADKSYVNARLSINEYADLNNTTLEHILTRFLEREAEELLVMQLKLL